MRNQLNPIGNGGSGVYVLNAGQSYTWRFTTISHGVDTGKFTQSLFFQVHDYACGSSPLTVLGRQNMSGGPTGQVFYYQSGGRTGTTPYTDGGMDQWQITVVPSTTATGRFVIWRNGVQLADWENIGTFACGAKPFWNVGPYFWDWTNGNAVSSLDSVEIDFPSIEMTSP